MSDESGNDSKPGYKCGQCYYLKGYGRGHVSCEEKYDMTESSPACSSFKLKETVQTCRQCKWLDTPSRGRNCKERGYDEYSKACWQYKQAPHGFEQVNSRVMVKDTIANTFEVDSSLDEIPFLIKQDNFGILITVTPGKKGKPPRYSVKTIELEEDGLPVFEEHEIGNPRIAYQGSPSAVIDDHGLVQLNFVLDKKKSEVIATDLDQLLAQSPSVSMDNLTESDDLIQKMYDQIIASSGNLDKNILKLVAELSSKFSWDLHKKDSMLSKLRERFES